MIFVKSATWQFCHCENLTAVVQRKKKDKILQNFLMGNICVLTFC